jgi:hypothetical protein
MANGDFNRLVLGFTGEVNRDAPVISRLPDAPTWVADVPVTVDPQHDNTVVINLQRGAYISGRVVFDGAKPKPTPDDLVKTAVIVRPADGGGLGTASPVVTVFPQPRIERDGSFRSIGLSPGDYVVNVAPISGVGFASLSDWTTTSITVGGREAIGTGIAVGTADVPDVVVTLSDNPPELIGTVRDARGNAVLGSRVIVFPRARAQRQYVVYPAPNLVRQLLVDRSGVCRSKLAPGQYFVVAVLTMPADWMTPDYLQALEARATPVALGIGDRRNLNLTAISFPYR